MQVRTLHHIAAIALEFRAASTATERSVEDLLIKILGCWQSSAYQCYMKILSERLAVVLKILASE